MDARTQPVWREKTKFTSLEIWAEPTSKVWHDSGLAIFPHLYQEKDRRKLCSQDGSPPTVTPQEKNIFLSEDMPLYWQWIVCTLVSINRDVDALSWHLTTAYLLKNVCKNYVLAKQQHQKLALWTEHVVSVLLIDWLIDWLIFRCATRFSRWNFKSFGTNVIRVWCK